MGRDLDPRECIAPLAAPGESVPSSAPPPARSPRPHRRARAGGGAARPQRATSTCAAAPARTPGRRAKAARHLLAPRRRPTCASRSSRASCAPRRSTSALRSARRRRRAGAAGAAGEPRRPRRRAPQAQPATFEILAEDRLRQRGRDGARRSPLDPARGAEEDVGAVDGALARLRTWPRPPARGGQGRFGSGEEVGSVGGARRVGRPGGDPARAPAAARRSREGADVHHWRGRIARRGRVRALGPAGVELACAEGRPAELAVARRGRAAGPPGGAVRRADHH